MIGYIYIRDLSGHTVLSLISFFVFFHAILTRTALGSGGGDIVVDAFGVSPTIAARTRIYVTPSSSIPHSAVHPLFSSMRGIEEDPIDKQQRSATTSSNSDASSSPSPSPSNIESSTGGALAKHPTSDDAWSKLQPIKVQGGSLRTWSFATPLIDAIQVHLRTDGRPLNANVELWQGPDNTPQKVAVYIEDGAVRPFRCTMITPDVQNAVSIRNTAQMEYPIHAAVQADLLKRPSSVDANDDNQSVVDRLASIPCTRTIQGGAVLTMPFGPSTASVEILLKTDGRPLNARVELLQGPNNVKQVMEVYTEDGHVRPFNVIVDMPGTGYVVRIVNTATVEFPIMASVEPYLVEGDNDDYFITS